MKISVVGGGNAGVFTALYWSWYGKDQNVEVELFHDPEIPPEEVGQASLLVPPQMLWESCGFNWYNNPIKATMKSGILYEGFGKVNDKVFHAFSPSTMAMHYCPSVIQSYILNSGNFKVTEGDVDPKDIDADLVWDCRGKPKDFSNYDELINPLNSVILSKKEGRDLDLTYTRSVATPHGWTFIIPNHDSVSYGYLYNNEITSKEDAENNMREMFDVEVGKHNHFKNYVVKDMVIDGRIALNGNRLFFLEPMEATALHSYIEVATALSNHGIDRINYHFQKYIREIQNFILWHYSFGSKYDTPFWDYAKSLKFVDSLHDSIVRECKECSWHELHKFMTEHQKDTYGMWTPYAFKNWYEGMTTKKQR